MKSFIWIILLTSLLSVVYLVAIDSQLTFNLSRVEYIRQLDDVKRIQSEDLEIALQRIEDGSLASSLNINILYGLLFINLIVIVYDAFRLISQSKKTKTGP